ncbi:MAG TPA: hypothetical protein VEL76_38345, partial [Gemmataceae bacterium]|nr:hypothetical protein [Gemmataceae bacterium]
MLNVFVTVDTEAWPFTPDWRASRLEQDIRRDVFGETGDGAFGLNYQLDLLNTHGLKAIFLVEALFACAVGLEPLRRIVELIQGKGHEVQLHLHTEWLQWLDPSPLPGRTGRNMKDFSEEEQAILIARGAENLRSCGVRDLCAFRAGNYGANFDTLRALARNGLRYDTSHNTCYLDAECGMRTPRPFLQPCVVNGVWEFPISFFRDWPGHYRHAQVCACSAQEIEAALMQAWRRGWYSFVLVAHSFELLKRHPWSTTPARPDR